MFSIFNKYNLVSEVSTRQDGSMRLSLEDSEKDTIEKNRSTFLYKLSLTVNNVVATGLKHGNRMAVVDSNNGGQVIDKTDGLITGEMDLYLSITVADCLPIFFYDPEHRAIALIHAGWKGLDLGIIKNCVRTLIEKFAADVEQVLIGIGPGIGVCHYFGKEGVTDNFRKYENAIIDRDGKEYIDLKLIAHQQLKSEGVLEDNIEDINECTYCKNDKYFSWRKEQYGELKTMIAIFGMRKLQP